MADRALRVIVLVLVWLTAAPAASLAGPAPPASATVLWYTHPAEKWENALPVGNGRLGAMVFGRADEEIIQLNEDTYWSGGPYSTTVAGGYKALPEIRRLLFDGQLIQAHRLFGRHLMGYPVEQQKYQSLGNLVLTFPAGGAQTGYRHELDLDTAVATTTYERDGTRYRREVFSSPVDQVIVVRLTAEPARAPVVHGAVARRSEPGAFQLRHGLLQDGRRRPRRPRRPRQVGGLPRRRRAAPVHGPASRPRRRGPHRASRMTASSSARPPASRSLSPRRPAS